MLLTEEQQAMSAGDVGRGPQKAMEIVVALGRIYGAAKLLPISSAHVIGVSYKYLGDAGFEFLEELAKDGVHACVPTTLNPPGIDLKMWQEMGVSEAYARKQLAVVDMYTEMGVAPTCTCTPYLVGNEPQKGAHVAWCESSALIYANSVLGAWTNREGGPSALASAIQATPPLTASIWKKTGCPHTWLILHARWIAKPISALWVIWSERLCKPVFLISDYVNPRFRDWKT